jgi:hypothetical protein
LRPFYKAYKLKNDDINDKLWLQGLYVYEAILRASPILAAFAKAGTKPIPYLEEPYKLDKTEKEQSTKVNEEDEVKQVQLKAQLFFKSWARVNKGLGK